MTHTHSTFQYFVLFQHSVSPLDHLLPRAHGPAKIISCYRSYFVTINMSKKRISKEGIVFVHSARMLFFLNDLD